MKWEYDLLGYLPHIYLEVQIIDFVLDEFSEIWPDQTKAPGNWRCNEAKSHTSLNTIHNLHIILIPFGKYIYPIPDTPYVSQIPKSTSDAPLRSPPYLK